MNRFLRACRREEVDRPPVWVMRQAGRYLPEYREVRKRAGDFLTMCYTPEIAAEVTLQPIRRFGLDAAIVFSDILTPLVPMGAELTFTPSPHIANPVREPEDVDRVRAPRPWSGTEFLGETLHLVRSELDSVHRTDRILRRPVDPRLLSRRRCDLAFIHQGQVVRPPPPGGLRPTGRHPGRRYGRLPAHPGRSGRPGRADLRLLGRRAGRRGRSAVGAASRTKAPRGHGRSRRAQDLLPQRRRPPAPRSPRHALRGHRARLEGRPPARGDGAAGCRAAGQPRSRAPSWGRTTRSDA